MFEIHNRHLRKDNLRLGIGHPTAFPWKVSWTSLGDEK